MNKNFIITAELKFIISLKKRFKNSHPEVFTKDVQPTLNFLLFALFQSLLPSRIRIRVQPTTKCGSTRESEHTTLPFSQQKHFSQRITTREVWTGGETLMKQLKNVLSVGTVTNITARNFSKTVFSSYLPSFPFPSRVPSTETATLPTMQRSIGATPAQSSFKTRPSQSPSNRQLRYSYLIPKTM